jgi:hypothetical protein
VTVEEFLSLSVVVEDQDNSKFGGFFLQFYFPNGPPPSKDTTESCMARIRAVCGGGCLTCGIGFVSSNWFDDFTSTIINGLSVLNINSLMTRFFKNVSLTVRRIYNCY